MTIASVRPSDCGMTRTNVSAAMNAIRYGATRRNAKMISSRVVGFGCSPAAMP